MATRKKGFSDDLNNPALGFISGADPDAKQDKVKPESREEAFKRLQAYAESLGIKDYRVKAAPRNRRLQLVLSQELFDNIQAFLAGRIDPRTGRQISLNEWFNQIAAAAIDAEEERTMER